MRWGHTCRVGSVDRLFPLLAPYLRDLERPRFNRELGAVRAFAVLRDARVGEGPLLGRELESQLRAIHV